jgi:hypothetical protein
MGLGLEPTQTAMKEGVVTDTVAVLPKDNAESWKASEPDVTTTSQLLAALWDMINKGSQLERGVSREDIYLSM